MTTINFERAVEDVEREDAKKHPIILQWASMTKDELIAWVDDNVDSVADVKQMLGVLLYLVMTLHKRID